MKNRLLTALLTLATVPFFANAKITNAELLTHLQQIRTEILYAIQQNNGPIVSDNDLPTKNFAFKVINEFYDNSILLQQLLCDKIKNDFNLLLDGMINLDQLPHELTYVEPAIEQKTKDLLYQELEPIYVKYHQQYCIDYPNGVLVAVTADDIFEEILEIIFNIKEPHAWIQKLDVKIAELAQ